MTRYSIIIAIFTAIIIGLGVNIGIGVHNAEQITNQFGVVCAEHKTLARIAKEETEELISENNKFLPRVSIPGISHQELLDNVEQKTRNKARHVAELELIRRETC